MHFDGFDSGRALNNPGGLHFPCQSGPAGYPQPGSRLIGTALVVHSPDYPLDRERGPGPQYPSLVDWKNGTKK